MGKVKSENTKPEMKVRRLIHSLGYRYRLHRKDLPGKPDMVFFSRKKVIFIHGCFWHGHSCKRGNRIPKTHTDYWLKKIDRNVERDLANREKLKEKGFDILVIWECEIKELEFMTNRIISFLDNET